MIPAELKDILVSTPDTLSGEIRFAGTRVPVRALFDTVMDGTSVEEFFRGFPNVTREQAEAVLRWEHDLMHRTLGLEPRF
jgi:uncharacterized protein (DUF433 family)